ncbi:MAG TPA: D-tagatose-bisphosphate aldolase, class II, non-catalytic subunit [Anaerolineales bacterium]
MSHPLDELVRAQKRGEPRGMTSICSAHPWVLKAALHGAGPVLIESTCNQVNQFGGYTGMTPADFVRFVEAIAARNGFPEEQLLLGGDHLGPSPWQEEPATSAMAKAAEMVCFYVRAGFAKIHLDASMRLADDPPGPLDSEVSVRRTAELARLAEEVVPDPVAAPRYVIGTEVPFPGGRREHEDGVSVTRVEDARRTLEIMHAAFMEAGLESAWERVIAMVVQPGVEFGDDFVLDYNPAAARELANFSEKMPFVYEVHSTDYQSRDNLRSLVRDHFAVLKVGPALTYAYREAIFALAMMENELIPAERRSNLVEVLEEVMIRQPEHWQKYYHGDEAAQRLARKFSLSDRIRYYWGSPPVQFALGRLLQNLGEKTLPLTLVSQYVPGQWERIRSGQIANTPEAVILDKVDSVLEEYAFAQG